MKNYRFHILVLWLATISCCPARASDAGRIEVRFSGNDIYSAKTLLKQMAVKWPQGQYSPDSLEVAVGRIRSFYGRQGYLAAGISHIFSTQAAGGAAGRVEISITEGRRTAIQKISFNGNSILNDDQLSGFLRIKPGQGLDLSALGENDFNLMLLYADYGCIYAEVDHEVNYQTTCQAELVFNIKEGPRAKIGRILIKGNLLTKSPVIERDLTFKTGETFSRRALLRSQLNLLSTGLFKEVKVTPGSVNPDRSEIEIEVEVREKPSHVFATGFGYGSGDAFRLSAGWSNRNIGGWGRSMEFKALTAFQVWSGLKTVRRQAIATYLEPWLWGGRTQSEVSLYYDDFRPPYTDYRLQIIGLDFMVSKLLGRYSNLGGRWKQEWLKLSPNWREQGSAADTVRYRGRRALQLFGQYRRYDDPVNPRSGLGYEWETDYTGGLLGGTETYQRLMNEWIFHYKPHDHFGISTRLKYGIIGDWALKASVPNYEKFYLGGPTSMRGYSSGRMGQVDAAGNNIGGDKMGLVNVELKVFFPKHWVGALFADAGLLENCHVTKLSMSQWRGTPGFGARYVFPFGTGRADFAFQPDKIDRIKYWRAVLAWGEAF